jgi:drug/metabolite transporter (DMT)-like permease
VLIWGFTGILGGLISLEANEITFFRTGIAFISLVLIGFFIRGNRKLSKKEVLWLVLTGVIVGLHWITFFYSIKISTISIAVVCMSASSLFTSFLEPLIFKRRYYFSELILSIAVSIGVLVIFGFESKHTWGIVIGLISAFLSALYNTLNGMFVKDISSQKIAQYEMLGGLLTAAAFLLSTDNLHATTFDLGITDLFYLLVLALVCTTFAFMTSVWVMKFVTPFTVSISVNMEPVYTILLALWIDWYRGTNSEKMTDGFYLGGAIILVTILIHAWLKTRLLDGRAKKSRTKIPV